MIWRSRMREYCDVSVVANMVAMLRADVDGAIWVIDDDDESRFYEGGAHDSGRVLPAPQSTLNVMHELKRRGIEGIVGITRGDVSSVPPPPLLRPDVGDAASLLLLSEGLDQVLGSVGGMAW